MKKINEVKVGEKYIHPTKGEATVIKVSKRTIVMKFPFSTRKNVYDHADSYFYITDF